MDKLYVNTDLQQVTRESPLLDIIEAYFGIQIDGMRINETLEEAIMRSADPQSVAGINRSIDQCGEELRSKLDMIISTRAEDAGEIVRKLDVWRDIVCADPALVSDLSPADQLAFSLFEDLRRLIKPVEVT
ncbi:MAG: hypothetical protein ABJG15_10700 [Hyphomonadaceae bacterium]